jgi:hypothetical protein
MYTHLVSTGVLVYSRCSSTEQMIWLACMVTLPYKMSMNYGMNQKLLLVFLYNWHWRWHGGQIHPSQKIYSPYPKCSALMSLIEVIQPMQESCSKYTATDVATLRKCVKCRGSFCISCKVPWHDRMSCYDYKRVYPHARPEDAKLQNLANQRLWRQCIRCKHMIELAEGCYHMTCV